MWLHKHWNPPLCPTARLPARLYLNETWLVFSFRDIQYLALLLEKCCEEQLCQKKFVLQYLSPVHHFCNYTNGWFLLALLNLFPMTFMSSNWAKSGEKFPAVLIVLGSDVQRTQSHVWIKVIVIICFFILLFPLATADMLKHIQLTCPAGSWWVQWGRNTTQRLNVVAVLYLLETDEPYFSPLCSPRCVSALCSLNPPPLPGQWTVMNGHYPITALINGRPNCIMDCGCMAMAERAKRKGFGLLWWAGQVAVLTL